MYQEPIFTHEYQYNTFVNTRFPIAINVHGRLATTYPMGYVVDDGHGRIAIRQKFSRSRPLRATSNLS